MNVGWIGLGKLGLPCALVLAQHHRVWGYDVSEKPWRILDGQEPPMQEEGLDEMLHPETGFTGRVFRSMSVQDLVHDCDVIFVAVQTPHAPEFGGEKPMPPGEVADFEYAYLVQACRDVARAAQGIQKPVTLVVVSTVLPGTTNRIIRPALNRWVELVYSPQFIAMGTTIHDFRSPEFVICGSDRRMYQNLRDVFLPVHGNDRLFCTDIVTAESIKVLYNTYVSTKIVWANHVMEMAQKTGANCDDIVDALSRATDRVISDKYMRGGMGDGGACHPRDLIAMAWLERRLEMSFPLFGGLALARQVQTQWLADLVRHYVHTTGHKLVILGEAYKPGSDLMSGSPALLLRHYLEDLNPYHVDPKTWHHKESKVRIPPVDDQPRVFVVATKHPEWRERKFHPGSVLIDPFGYIGDQEGVTVIRVGRP